MSQNTKVIVCYHKESRLFKNECLTPILAGTVEHELLYEGMIGDNSGDNISHKHPIYCELSALYWMWKNIDADNYGLFHYRRLLDIKNKYNRQEYFSKIDINDFSEKDFNKLMENFDIIVPHNSNFKINLYEHYKKTHYIKDLDIVIDIIKEKYPNYTIAIEKALSSKKGYFSNMFIMKKNILQEYCTWLFDILEETEKHIDVSNYDSNQKRLMGFLGERLFNIFVQYKILTDPNIKIKKVRRIFLNEEPLKRKNFLFGSYIEYTNKVCLNILGIKMTKRIRRTNA